MPGPGPNALLIEESLNESVPQTGYLEDFTLVSTAGQGTTASPFDATVFGLDADTARNYTFVCPGHIAPNTTVQLVLALGIAANATTTTSITGKIIRRNGTTTTLSLQSHDAAAGGAAARHEYVTYSWAGSFSAGDVITFNLDAAAASQVVILGAILRALRHASLANVRSRTTRTLTF